MAGDSELKPCPFCGSEKSMKLLSQYELEEWEQEDIDGDPNEESFSVVCSVNNGGCGASGGYSLSKEYAKYQWNRRTT